MSRYERIQEQLHIIKSEVHVLLSGLPKSDNEVLERLNTIRMSAAAAGSSVAGMIDDTNVEKAKVDN